MSKFKDLMLDCVQSTEVKMADGTKVKVRAFLMKEMKMLVLAQEANQGQEQVIVDILKSCIVSKNIDVEKLAIFDIEWLYLEIWKLSKGTSFIPMTFTCQNEIDVPISDESLTETRKQLCGESIKVNANLSTVEFTETPNDTLVINDNFTLKMRYPNVLESEFFDIEKDSDVFNLINRCISEVHLKSEVLQVGRDMDESELSELMEYVDEKGFEKLANFVTKMPTLQIIIPVKCSKCGTQEAVKLTGLQDFLE